jgi:hypothetical protein
MSMIPNCLANNDEVELLFGVRAEADLFATNWLNNLKTKYSSFKFFTTLSRPEESWAGLKGRVTEQLGKLDITTNADYYLCGNLEMVKQVRELLAAKGVAPGSVHFEIF